MAKIVPFAWIIDICKIVIIIKEFILEQTSYQQIYRLLKEILSYCFWYKDKQQFYLKIFYIFL